MTNDQGPVVQSALLRGELVRLRKDKNLIQEQVAHQLDWSPSKLIRIEGGRSSVTRTDLDALLTAYGVGPGSARERLQALNRGAREDRWWSSYQGGINPTYVDYVGYETGASFIRQYQGGFIPGLVQTPEYAEILTSNSIEAMEVAPVVRLRLQRQVELARRSSPPKQFYILDESVIRRHIGVKTDPSIMPNQLRHLADWAEREELLSVRVIPFEAGAHRGLTGTFTLLAFDGALPDLLYIDSGRDPSLIAGDDPRIADYAGDFEILLEDALSFDESIGLIRKVAEDMS